MARTPLCNTWLFLLPLVLVCALPSLAQTPSRKVLQPTPEVRKLLEKAAKSRSPLALRKQALARARKLKDRAGEASSLQSIGLDSRWQNRPREAIPYLRQALALHRRLGDRPGEAAVLKGLGDALAALNRTTEAAAYLDRAIAVYRTLGDRNGEASVECSMHRVCEDADVMRGHYEKAVSLVASLDPAQRDEAVFASALQGLGRLPEALAHYRIALRQQVAAGNASRQAWVTGAIAHNLRRLGRIQEALKVNDAARNRFTAIGEHFGVTFFLADWGDYYAGVNQPGRAASLLEQALPDVRDYDRRWMLARLGEAHLRSGNPERAARRLREAVAMARSLGKPYDEDMARSMLFEALSQSRQWDELARESEAQRKEWRARNAPDRVAPFLRVAFGLSGTRRFRASLHFAEQALPFFREVQDTYCEAWALYFIARNRWALGQEEEALPVFDQARALFASHSDHFMVAWCEPLRALLLAGKEDTKQARAAFWQAVPIILSHPDPANHPWPLNTLLMQETPGWSPPPAPVRLEDALAERRAARDEPGTARLLFALAVERQTRFDSRGAAHALQAAVEAYRRAGDRDGEMLALSALGNVERALGRHRMARDRHRTVLADCIKRGDRRGEGRERLHLGLDEAAGGDPEQAFASLLQAESTFRSLEEALAANAAAVLAVRIAMDQKGTGPERHLSQYQRLADSCRASGDRASEAYIYLNQARFLRARGQMAVVLASSERAREIYRARSDTHYEAECGFLAADALRNLDRLEEAQAETERAVAFFRKAGNEWMTKANNEWMTAHALEILADARGRLGFPDERVDLLFQALASFRRQRKQDQVIWMLMLLFDEAGKREESGRERLYGRILKEAGASENRKMEVDTLVSMAAGLITGSRPGEARRLAERAEHLGRQIGYTAGRANAVYHLALCDRGTGKPAEALIRFEQARAVIRALGMRGNEGYCLIEMGDTLLRQGQWRRAAACYTQGIEACQAASDRAGVSRCIVGWARAHPPGQPSPDIAALVETHLRPLRATGDAAGEAGFLAGLTRELCRHGEHRQALRWLERLRDLHRVLKDRAGEEADERQLADSLLSMGYPRRAVPRMESLVSLLAPGGSHGETVPAVLKLAQAYLAVGLAPDAAAGRVQERLARGMVERPVLASTLDAAGQAFHKSGSPEAARAFYERALALYRALGDRKGEAAMLDGIGEARLSLDGLIEAIKSSGQAVKLAREVGELGIAAHALYIEGKGHLQANDLPGAESCFEAQLALYPGAGADSDVQDVMGLLPGVYRGVKHLERLPATVDRVVASCQAADRARAAADLLVTLAGACRGPDVAEQGALYGQRAADMYESAGDATWTAYALGGACAAWRSAGQPDRARQVLARMEQLASRREAAGDPAAAGEVRWHMGQACLELGAPEQALACWDRAVALARMNRAATVAHNSLENRALYKMACWYVDNGQTDRALDLYERAIALYRGAGKQNHVIALVDSLNIVGAERMDSEPLKALGCFLDAIRLSENDPPHNPKWRVRYNAGVVYLNLGQPEKALELFTRALRAWSEPSADAAVLTMTGSIYLQLGRPLQAVCRLEKSLCIALEIGNEWNKAVASQALARAYLAAGRPRDLLDLLATKASLVRILKPGTTPDSDMDILRLIGRAFTALGEPRKALLCYEKSLSASLGDHTLECQVESLVDKAKAEEALGRLPQADETLQKALVLLESYRAGLGGWTEAKISWTALEINAYRRRLAVLLRLGRNVDAFALAQQAKARGLLDMMQEGRARISAVMTEEEKRQEEGLRQRASLLNQRMVAEGVRNQPGSRKRYAALKQQMAATERELEIFNEGFYTRHPGLAMKRVAKTAALSDLGKWIPKDTALLEYVVVQEGQGPKAFDRIVLFVVTASGGKPQVRVCSTRLACRELEARVNRFRSACFDYRRSGTAAAKALYRLILKPAGKYVEGKKRLVVCPDGPLWDVSFAALVDEQGGFLLERFELAYAYSVTGAQASLQTRAPAGRAAPGRTLLAFANPAFGTLQRIGDQPALPGQRPITAPSRPITAPSRPILAPSRPITAPSRPILAPSRPILAPSRPIMAPSRAALLGADIWLPRGARLVPLPGAEREARAIRRAFPDAVIYTGKQAQEATLKQEIARYRYLHLATHGFFNDAAPLLSALVLAQPGAGSEEDGFLTARELFEMDLGAEMAVLSACNTARGEKRTGEGLVGMTWALFAAGVPTQVLAQWAVDDAAAAMLMARFYAGLKAGRAKGTALREAALALRADGKHAHPYYWAPFVLMGDWR